MNFLWGILILEMMHKILGPTFFLAHFRFHFVFKTCGVEKKPIMLHGLSSKITLTRYWCLIRSSHVVFLGTSDEQCNWVDSLVQQISAQIAKHEFVLVHNEGVACSHNRLLVLVSDQTQDFETRSCEKGNSSKHRFQYANQALIFIKLQNFLMLKSDLQPC